MATLSFDQFTNGKPVKVLGNEANRSTVSNFYQAPAPKQSVDTSFLNDIQPGGSTQLPQQEDQGFLSGIGSDFSKRNTAMKDAQQDPNRNIGGKIAETFNQGLGFVGDIVKRGVEKAGEGISAVTPEPLKQGFHDTMTQLAQTDAGQAAIEAMSKGQAEWEKFQKEHPDSASVIGLVGNTASLIPTLQGLRDAGYLTKFTADLVKDAAGSIVKPGIEAAGSTLKGAGKFINKTAFDLNTNEANVVQNHASKLQFLKNELNKAPVDSEEYDALKSQIDTLKANKPITQADTALEKGIMGTEKMIGKQAGTEKLNVWKNTVEPALANSDKTITKDELFAKARQTVADEVEPGRKKELQSALDALEDDYKDFQNTDLLTANQIKSSLDEFTPSKIFKGQEVANGYKTLKADLANSIRQKTYDSIDNIDIKKAYRDYANLKQLENVGIKALTDSTSKGGFGNFWSGLYNKVLTPIKTVGGQVLYRVGDKLEFLGKKGIKTLGEELESKEVQPTSFLEGNSQAGFAKNPFAGKGSEDMYDKTAKALMNADLSPVKVNGALEFGDKDLYFRLNQLQEKLDKKALTPSEVEEAYELMKKAKII